MKTMNKRAMTVSEIKAMLESLADKVTEEGADLYQDITAKIGALSTASAAKAESLLDELVPELNSLKQKVTDEGKEIIYKIEERIGTVKADIQEEIQELKEKGVVQWAKDNPMIAMGIVGVVAVVVVVLASL